MKMYLVPIKDAEEVKPILLLALIFFGMTAQFVVDRGPSNATFLILPIARKNLKEVYQMCQRMITQSAVQPPHTAEELYKIYRERQDLKTLKNASRLIERREEGRAE